MNARFLRDITTAEATEGWSAPLHGAPDDVLYQAGKLYKAAKTCDGSTAVYTVNGVDFWFPPRDSFELVKVVRFATILRDVTERDLGVSLSKKVLYKTGEVCKMAGDVFVFLADGSDFWALPEDAYSVNDGEEVTVIE